MTDTTGANAETFLPTRHDMPESLPSDGSILDSEGHELAFLDPATVTFSRTPGGILRVALPEVCHRRVEVLRCLPLRFQDGFLSIRCDGQEVGLLRRLDDLAPDQRALVEDHLTRRYFQPTIRRVHQVQDLRGSYRWTVDTDRGHTDFETAHPRHAVTPLGEDAWLITDINGNRFEIQDLATLDRRSRQIVRDLLA